MTLDQKRVDELAPRVRKMKSKRCGHHALRCHELRRKVVMLLKKQSGGVVRIERTFTVRVMA